MSSESETSPLLIAVQIWLKTSPTKDYNDLVVYQHHDLVLEKTSLKVVCPTCARGIGVQASFTDVAVKVVMAGFVKHRNKCSQKLARFLSTDTGTMELTLHDTERYEDAEAMDTERTVIKRVPSLEDHIRSASDLYADEGISVEVRDSSFIVKCKFCPALQINITATNSWLHNISQHVSAKGSSKNIDNHTHRKNQFKGQLFMNAWLEIQDPVQSTDFENPHLAMLCLNSPVGSGSKEEEVLLFMQYRDSLDFLPVLRPRPIEVKALPGTKAVDITVGHAFKSIDCSIVSPFLNRPFPGHICLNCKHIPTTQQFTRELDKRTPGLVRFRAHVDEHTDKIVDKLRLATLMAQRLRRIVMRNALMKARPTPNLSTILKVRTRCATTKPPCVDHCKMLTCTSLFGRSPMF